MLYILQLYTARRHHEQCSSLSIQQQPLSNLILCIAGRLHAHDSVESRLLLQLFCSLPLHTEHLHRDSCTIHPVLELERCIHLLNICDLHHE